MQQLGKVSSMILTLGSLLISSGEGETCHSGFSTTNSLIGNAVLLGDIATASGKEQWLFPTVNITCSTTVTALYFLGRHLGNGGMRNKYPQLQLWRQERSNEYTKTYEVSTQPSLVRAGVYQFSGISWSVQAGDILGVYQPDLKKSKNVFSFQKNGAVSTYRLTNERNSPSSFTLTDRDVRTNLQHYPLVAIELNNPQCASGFLTLDNLLTKGDLVLGATTNNLVEHHDQLRLLPGMNFGCNGTISKCTFAAEKRAAIDGQETYPHLQVWESSGTSLNVYMRRSSLALGGSTKTPHLNVFEVVPSEPLEFRAGDVLGLYLPPEDQTSLVMGFQQTDSNDAEDMRSYVYPEPLFGQRASLFFANSFRVHSDQDAPMITVEITVECGAPERPMNGVVTAPSTVNGSTATYTCDSGYNLEGVDERVCKASDGMWANNVPTCKPVDCGMPQPLAHGQLIANSTTYNSRATYTCGRGFQPSRTTALTCQSNGEWSGPLPKCEGIQCSGLTVPGYGDIQVIANRSDTQVDAQALYTCNPGYTLHGESTRTCQEDGNWAGEAPVCVADCSPLTSISGGSIVLLNNSTTIGSVAVYSCNKRLKMVGNENLTCGDDSTWSSNPPICESIECGLPTQPVHGMVSTRQNQTTLDAVVEYSCEEGYLLAGNKTRVCQKNESWSGLAPKCTKNIESTTTVTVPTVSTTTTTTTTEEGTEHTTTDNDVVTTRTTAHDVRVASSTSGGDVLVSSTTNTDGTDTVLSSTSGNSSEVTGKPGIKGLSPNKPKISVGNLAIIAVIAVLSGIIVLMVSAIVLLYVHRKKQHRVEVNTAESTLQDTSVDNPVYEGDQRLSFNMWNSNASPPEVPAHTDPATYHNPAYLLQNQLSKDSSENLHYHVSTLAIPDIHQHYEFADIVGTEPHYDTASNCGASQYEVPVSPYEIPTTQHKHSDIYGSLPWGTYVPTEEQRKSTYGSTLSIPVSLKSPTSGDEHQIFFTESEIYWRPASDSASLYEQLARNKYREILRKQIQITEHLGSGYFGNVDRGLWQSPVGVLEVAIKTLKQGSDENDKIKFLQEGAINGQFRHENVVKLHGVVTVGEPVMMVLELLPNGDLRDYLVRTKPAPGEMIPLNWPKLLLKFCKNIASGMEYLSMKAFIHRDLAARNILVAEDKTCKISDFGLSRDLEDESYYISHGGKIPVKWTAPEALHFKKYSTASDVWSFGAVMYEIWSLGHKPFQSCTNLETIKLIDRGYRLPPPPGCPKVIYSLMIQCWHPDASSRPSFPTLLRELKRVNTTDWFEQDGHTHTQANVLGASLEAGKNLYLELQQSYVIKE